MNIDEIKAKAAELKPLTELKSPEEIKAAAEYSVRGFKAVLFGEKAFRSDLVIFIVAAAVACLLPADSEWRVADLVVKVEPFAVGVNCQIDGRNVPKPGNATLSPGRHVVEYSREDYKPQTIEFEVSLAARTVPRADDAKWQPTAALAALEKALASAATAKSSEDWDAVLKLVNQADVLARDNMRKRDELRDKAERARREGDSRAKVAGILAEAQMCYENQNNRDVVVQYSNARDNGHILDDNETYMLEDAFNQLNIYYDRHLKEWRLNDRLGRKNTRSLEAIQNDKSELLRLYMNAKRK